MIVTQYKLIATDIDGTLLDSSGVLRADTLRAIEAAKARGLRFTLSTGRPMLGARPLLHLVSPGVPLIVENGGALVLPEDGRRVFRKLLGAAPAAEAIARGQALGAKVAVWLDDHLYYNHRDKYTERYYELLAGRGPLPLSDPRAQFPNGVDKVVWLGDAPLIERLHTALLADPIPGARASLSMPTLLEFMDSEISKAATLRRLGRYLGVDMAETVALGDGFNDLEMLQTAGLGIAMGNAPEALRRAADWVVPSNDEGGFAIALDRLV